MQKLTTNLWFDNQAEDAALFYTSVFSDSKMGSISRYGEDTPGVPGSVMTVQFELSGMPFVALNGGPVFQFTPAISFIIDCKSQEEVDHYWDKLSEGGEVVQCGWLKDKFGVSWQVIPSRLMELLNDSDPEKSYQVIQAMLKMIKLDIPSLEKAYRGD